MSDDLEVFLTRLHLANTRWVWRDLVARAEKDEWSYEQLLNSMVLGQPLGEWCGHGPVLEQDIALTNIALDLIREARSYYQYLAEIENKKEDDYPMFRDERQFRNVLLVEQPNGNWADTMVRQFLFDCWHYYHLEAMTTSTNQRLSAISKKSIKEANYHLAFSSEWVIRLGDGTDESHLKVQEALDNLMPYFDEFFIVSEFESACHTTAICPVPETSCQFGKIKISRSSRPCYA